MEETIEIPWEILVESGAFQIGAYGVTENEVLPTLWSEEIKIEYATDTNGETPKPYSLNEIEQLKLQKQNKLTAGANIVIENDVISAIGGGGGSGIVVDTTYNPDSYNAQSGKALAPEFDKTEKTENKVTVLDDYVTDEQYPSALTVYRMKREFDGAFGTIYDNFAQKDELSKKVDLSNKVTIIEESNTDEQYPSAKAVYRIKSELTKYIDDDFATFAWVANGFVSGETFNITIGDIETALDSIIAIQNELIGGNT
jgi:hypothetical protein